MQKTKIDWADSTWNPVTGCRHECPYCYARTMVHRFGKPDLENMDIIELFKPYTNEEGKREAYPTGFTPTLHDYRLGDYEKKAGRTIFVCSMADLFGDWVPDEWIRKVFDACEKAPQHRYLFLTKNPHRYVELAKKDLLPRQHWYGYSATREKQLWRFTHADECPCINLFVSIEPILEPMHPGFSTHTPADWVIIGAETGNRNGRVIPEKKWIDDIVEECEYTGRPVFMKESLRKIMGEDFRQEFPFERK